MGFKSRQKYEVANYDTYDIDFDDEEVEPITEDGFDSYDTEMDIKKMIQTKMKMMTLLTKKKLKMIIVMRVMLKLEKIQMNSKV